MPPVSRISVNQLPIVLIACNFKWYKQETEEVAAKTKQSQPKRYGWEEQKGTDKEGKEDCLTVWNNNHGAGSDAYVFAGRHGVILSIMKVQSMGSSSIRKL